MLKTCPKCRHENHEATGADDEACPACGVIYKKALEAMRAQRQQHQQALAKMKRNQPVVVPARQKFITPALARIAYLLMVLLFGAGIYFGFKVSVQAGLFATMWFAAAVVVGAIVFEAAIVLFVIADAVQDARDHLAVIRAQAEAADDA